MDSGKGRYDLIYMKTQKVDLREHHGIRYTGIEHRQVNIKIDHGKVLIGWAN